MDTNKLKSDILQLFQKSDSLQLNEISNMLRIKSDLPDYDVLKNILRDLCDQKLLSKSSRRRYSIRKTGESSDIESIINIEHDNGVCNIILPPEQKVTIKKRYLNTALDGDMVSLRLIPGKKKNKLRAEVISVIKRNESDFSGTLEFDDGFYFIIPDEEKYYIDFLVRPASLNGAQDGDRVTARFLLWDDPQKSPLAEITGIIGKAKSIGYLTEEHLDSIMDEFALPYEFPIAVVDEAKSYTTDSIKQEIGNRLDLRKETIITIDPDDAKDFDDALSLRFLDNGNREVGVHIADVSHYVSESGELDREALSRGNSVYLADRVVPMLPEELSNELCSLQPRVVRLAFSVFMEFDSKCEVVNYRVAESVIKSTKRFTYNEVQEIIDARPHKLSELINNLNALAKQLREKRFKTGGVDFESVEVKFILDETKNPVDAVLRKSSDATSLVEEFMLAANKIVAHNLIVLSRKHAVKPQLPFIWRVHDQPLNDKLSEVLEFIRTLKPDASLRGRSSKQINEFVRQFDDLPEKPIVHQMLLRSMAKAEYEVKNIGHYGLGFAEYTHFTSPIRRYPDLIVHRLTKEYSREKPSHNRIKELTRRLQIIAQNCSERERLAMNAERASAKLMQTAMAKKYIGKIVNGTISGIVSFGCFVLIDDFYAEGLLHIRDLNDDYYLFDERRYRFVGRSTKKVIQIGKRIRVRITKVDIDNRKIDLDFDSLL